MPGKSYKKGKGDESTTASYADMTLEAAFIFKFLVHNVWPKSHVSTTPKAVTPLIWHICKGGEVDVARIISRELKHVALSGLTHKATKLRSEERRVGKECHLTCRSRWSPYH